MATKQPFSITDLLVERFTLAGITFRVWQYFALTTVLWTVVVAWTQLPAEDIDANTQLMISAVIILGFPMLSSVVGKIAARGNRLDPRLAELYFASITWLIVTLLSVVQWVLMPQFSQTLGFYILFCLAGTMLNVRALSRYKHGQPTRVGQHKKSDLFE